MENNSIQNNPNENNNIVNNNEIIDKSNKEDIKENNENNQNINNENMQSEMLLLKTKKKTIKEIEREGTEINLFSNTNNVQLAEINVNIKKEENIIYEKLQINDEQIEKNSQNIDYSSLPKMKNGKILTKKDIYLEYIKESEDNCDKCPLRCLVFIPIFCGFCFLSIFDFITYMIVPLFYCLFYSLCFICNYCLNIVSKYQAEEEIGFSGAFTSENEIKIHIADEGGAMHLNEILCFSYMSACVKRYFCFIFVMINHILVPILQAWKKAKDCFFKSKIEELYDERMAKIEDAKQYKGFAQVEPQIDIVNNF